MAKPSPISEAIEALTPILDPSLLNPEDRHCTICQEPFQNPGRITRSQAARELPVRLPCNHIFGNECITRWLDEQATCPYCRRRFHSPKPSRPPLAARYPEVRIPPPPRRHHSLGSPLWASSSPTLAFTDLLAATEEAINLLNCYLLILTVMDSGRMTDEEREQLVVAFEYLSRVRPGMLSSVYAALYRRGNRWGLSL
ncbi:MAG: hypothetical protein Q9195_000127 [Heterodermia aff. obscurata]